MDLESFLDEIQKEFQQNRIFKSNFKRLPDPGAFLEGIIEGFPVLTNSVGFLNGSLEGFPEDTPGYFQNVFLGESQRKVLEGIIEGLAETGSGGFLDKNPEGFRDAREYKLPERTPRGFSESTLKDT